jgi:hypothetical protein
MGLAVHTGVSVAASATCQRHKSIKRGSNRSPTPCVMSHLLLHQVTGNSAPNLETAPMGPELLAIFAALLTVSLLITGRV